MKRVIPVYIVMVLAMGVVLYCGGNLLMIQSENSASQKQFEELSERFMVSDMRENNATTQETVQTAADPVPDEKLIAEIGVVEESQTEKQLAAFLQIRQEYPDMRGWLMIADTKVSYPVMQTPERPNYYLQNNVDGEPSRYGVPYLQEDCDLVGSDNLVVYGHHMKNGDVFGSLTKYRERDYWQEHPIITLFTENGVAEYEIFAVCCVSASLSVENVVPYNEFINASDAQDYDSFVEKAKKYACYDTGITPMYGQQLLTLSTCEYSIEDGRLAVIACKVG